MNSSETLTLIDKIDASVDRILHRIKINTWIFSVVASIVVLLALAMIVVLLRQNTGNAIAAANRVLATDANLLATDAARTAGENKARQEVLDKQLTEYINQNVAVWNKLQADNSSPKEIERRGLKVPVAPIKRPPGLPQPSSADLDRLLRVVPALSPTATPMPAQTPKPTRSPRARRPHPTPTPKPGFWQHVFDPKATR